MLEHVEPEDSVETRNGPVGDEESRRVEFDVNFVPVAFEKTQWVNRSQMWKQLRLESRPGTRAEKAAVGPERT